MSCIPILASCASINARCISCRKIIAWLASAAKSRRSACSTISHAIYANLNNYLENILIFYCLSCIPILAGCASINARGISCRKIIASLTSRTICRWIASLAICHTIYARALLNNNNQKNSMNNKNNYKKEI